MHCCCFPNGIVVGNAVMKQPFPKKPLRQGRQVQGANGEGERVSSLQHGLSQAFKTIAQKNCSRE